MHKVDMSFLRPFIDGTKHTFFIQARVKVTEGKPYLKEKTLTGLSIHIAGVVKIFSQNFRGMICLAFPAQTFLNLMERLLDEKHEKISPEIADGAGEMMNMIFGYAKQVLNERGHSLEKALPEIFYGNTIEIHNKNNDPIIILPFQSTLGDFQLEITFNKIKENKHV